MRITFRATGVHRDPALDRKLIVGEVRRNSGTWYAVAEGVGCGPDEGTPYDAVKGLLYAHAYSGLCVVIHD